MDPKISERFIGNTFDYPSRLKVSSGVEVEKKQNFWRERKTLLLTYYLHRKRLGK